MRPSLLFAAALIALPTLALGQMTPRGPTRFVDIVFFGDSHSCLLPGGPRRADLEATQGGFARAVAYVDRIRDRDQPSLVLHGGDLSIGDPIFSRFYAVPELSLLGQAAFDAVTVGNHEFDLGPLALLQTLTGVYGANPPFPLLSCNLDLSDPTVAGLDFYIDGETILQAGDLRIGVFGMTTPATNDLSQPDPVYVFEDIVPRATVAARSLNMAGCDAVVMLSHLGEYLDWVVATYTPGIDVILGAHDHLFFTEPVMLTSPSGPVAYAHAGELYRCAGRMRLRFDRRGVTVHQYELVPLGHRIKEDPMYRAQIDQFALGVEQLVPEMYSHVVTVATEFLDERVWHPLDLGYHDTGVGNLVADAWQLRGGTDIAVQASGFQTEPIYPGPILPVDLFHVNGYGFNAVDGLGFHLFTFQVPGLVVWGVLEETLATLELSDDLLVQVSGNMQYGYDPTEPPGSRLKWILVDGQPIDPNLLYSVTANEGILAFIANAAGPYLVNVQPLGVTEFQALWDYVEAHGLNARYPAGRVLAFDSTP